MITYKTVALTAMIVALPGLGHAANLAPGEIFADAAPLQKLIMIGLLTATLAGVVISGLKLAPGARLAGGSAFVSGLRAGGPIAGVLGGAYALLQMSFGLANVAGTPTLRMLAPAFAEAAALVALGCLTGTVAVALNWALEARIDREVLSG